MTESELKQCVKDKVKILEQCGISLYDDELLHMKSLTTEHEIDAYVRSLFNDQWGEY